MTTGLDLTMRTFAALVWWSTVACAAPRPPVQPIVRATLAPGQTLEVIGLRRWSLQMIQDSLAKYAPGESLSSHACIANLRYKLGFADAGLSTFSNTDIYDDRGNGKSDTVHTERIFLTVREPQDSGRVHPRRIAHDDITRQREWAPVSAAFLARLPLFESFARAYLRHGEASEAYSGRDSADVAVMSRVLASEHSAGGYARALAVLRTSGSNPDRAVAALILSRFPEHDDAWHTLLLAAVDDNQWLDAEIAQNVLEVMAERDPRTVNWKPVVPVIHDVLDGTAISALSPLVDVLLRTGVDTRSAQAFLGGGGEMLTAMLELSSVELSNPPHALLVALRGRDLGRTPGPWRSWIATLR